MTRFQRKYHERRAAGDCVDCGKAKATEGVHCTGCKRRRRMAQRVPEATGPAPMRKAPYVPPARPTYVFRDGKEETEFVVSWNGC